MKATTLQYLEKHPEFDKIVDSMVDLAIEIQSSKRYGRTGVLFRHRDGVIVTREIDEVREWTNNGKPLT